MKRVPQPPGSITKTTRALSVGVLALWTFAANPVLRSAEASPGNTVGLPDFVHDVAPILSRFGCNGSACHGKAEGQNGFKLSVFGNDPAADFEALVVSDRGRRIMPAAPDQSLVLRKSTAAVPHAGGPRMREDSREYLLLREWIANGAPYSQADRAEIATLRMEPPSSLLGFDQAQPLRVLAKLSDGSEEDVTWLAVFHSNNAALAEVNETGEVKTGAQVGRAAVMARYAGHIAVHHLAVPRPGAPANFEDDPRSGDIDRLVNANLRRLNLAPSSKTNDGGFLRRVYLDMAGRLPSPEEARRFLSDSRPDKRARLVDMLLERPEWADVWALKWSDLLRVDRRTLGSENAHAYYQWIRSAMQRNLPWNEFTRRLLEAEGPLVENPAGYFFKVAKKTGEMAANTSQALLGIRITCAECHQHPFDRWTQSDYHSMRAYFEQVKFKKSGEQESLVTEGDPKVTHPRTRQILHAHPLGTPAPPEDPQGDRRRALAEWMVSQENAWFAPNLANRIWAHFFGRGLVEPVDDVRATNPPSNPDLLAHLTKSLIASDFNPKELMREIANSDAYQRSPLPNATNEKDEQNFSRAIFRRLSSEVLLDAVCDVTGVPEKFAGVPKGLRAIQLWDSEQQSYFLKLFGRPQRNTPCECERSASASVSQTLHLMNSPSLQSKLSHSGGRIAQLVSSQTDDERVVEEIYLSCFARLPSSEERKLATAYLDARKARRQAAAEDLCWSLLNTLEFVFNH